MAAFYDLPSLSLDYRHNNFDHRICIISAPKSMAKRDMVSDGISIAHKKILVFRPRDSLATLTCCCCWLSVDGWRDIYVIEMNATMVCGRLG